MFGVAAEPGRCVDADVAARAVEEHGSAVARQGELVQSVVLAQAELVADFVSAAGQNATNARELAAGVALLTVASATAWKAFDFVGTDGSAWVEQREGLPAGAFANAAVMTLDDWSAWGAADPEQHVAEDAGPYADLSAQAAASARVRCDVAGAAAAALRILDYVVAAVLGFERAAVVSAVEPRLDLDPVEGMGVSGRAVSASRHQPVQIASELHWRLADHLMKRCHRPDSAHHP